MIHQPSAPTRRDWMLGAGGLIVGERQQRRPNILFAIADDWSWMHTSIGGDRMVRTPTFDGIARRGMLFRQSYCCSPSCTPSRAGILTGQWHWRLREGANLGGTLESSIPVTPDLLEEQGYHVGFTRKGWAPGDPAPGGRKRNPAGRSYRDFAEFLAARKAGQPFHFWFGSIDPHRPFDWESGVKQGFRPDHVVAPPYLPDDEIVRKDICDYYLEVERFDREVGGLLEALDRAGELDNTLIAMTGDNGWAFPRAKATLYEAGTHVPLAMAWGSRVSGGRTVDDFVSLTDLAPTFLEAAGLRPPAAMTGRSLVPILTGRKQGRVESARGHVLTGMERHVPCRGPEKGGFPSRALRNERYHYIRNYRPERWPAGDPNGLDQPGSQPFSREQLEKNTFVALADIDSGPSKAQLVLGRAAGAGARLYELAAGKRPARELYDLTRDPYQLKNVAEDPAYRGTLESLDRQLQNELAATGDPRASGKGDEFDSYVWYQGRQQNLGR
jgi:uncharacterized sulfatase